MSGCGGDKGTVPAFWECQAHSVGTALSDVAPLSERERAIGRLPGGGGL